MSTYVSNMRARMFVCVVEQTRELKLIQHFSHIVSPRENTNVALMLISKQHLSFYNFYTDQDLFKRFLL